MQLNFILVELEELPINGRDYDCEVGIHVVNHGYAETMSEPGVGPEFEVYQRTDGREELLVVDCETQEQVTNEEVLKVVRKKAESEALYLYENYDETQDHNW